MVVRTRRSTTTTTTSTVDRQRLAPPPPAQNNVVRNLAENQGQEDLDQKQEPSPPQQQEQHEQHEEQAHHGTTTSSSAASSITTHPVAIQQPPTHSTYHLLQHDRRHFPQVSTLKPSKLTTVKSNNTIGRTESSQSNHNHNISSTTTNVHEEDDYYHFDPSPTYADVDDLPSYDVQVLNSVEPTGLGSGSCATTSKMHNSNTRMPTLEMGTLQQQQQQQQQQKTLSQPEEPPPILDHNRPLLSHYHYNNESNNNDQKNNSTNTTPSQSFLSNTTPTRNGITCTVSFNVDQQRQKQQSKEQKNATPPFSATNATITTTSSNTGQSKVVLLKKQQRKRPPASETNNKQTKTMKKKKKLQTDSSSTTMETLTTANEKQTRGSNTGANNDKKKTTQTAKNKASSKKKVASKAEANQVKEKATIHGKTPPSSTIATPFSENATTTTPTSSGGKNRLDRLWQERFEELVTYHQQHGHTRVPYNHDNVTLAKWVDRQRGQYKRFTKGLSSTLTTDRIEQLNSLEFVWSVRGPRSMVDWNVRYQQLLDYRNQHNGSCLVPYNYKENPSLGKWVEKQRSLYKSYMALSSSLSLQGDKKGSTGNKQVQINADRIRALEEIGFVWSRQTNWMDRYEQLKEYKTWHGDCLVPQSFEDKGLVKWIEKQRSQYKYFSNHQKSQLTAERVNLLNGIDFVWSLRQSSKFKRLEWDDRFVQLQQYEQHHGNCLVPYNYEINPTLAKWVEKQRNMYNRRMEGKTSQLTDERIAKLEQLGFVWSLRDRHCGGNRSATKSKRFFDNTDEKVEVQHNNMFHDPNEQLTSSNPTDHCPSDSERTESSSNTQSYNASGIGDNKVGMSSEQEYCDDIKDDSMLPPLGDSSPLSILPEATTCPLVVVSDIKNPTCSILSSPIKNRFDI